MNSRPTAKSTRVLRIIRLAIHTMYGLFVAAAILPWVSPSRRNHLISRWSRELLAVLNIRLITRGTLPGPEVLTALFVANHVSWMDIHAINSVRAMRFIAKSEIRSWPILGWLVAQANTLFIERTRRHDTGRMVATVTDSLRSGDCICFFPEGTTTDGTELKPFKSSLMQAAINANALVWPVAIRYQGENGNANSEMAYCGDMTMLQSLRKVLAQSSPAVELHFLAPIAPAGIERQNLASVTRETIARSLGLVY